MWCSYFNASRMNYWHDDFMHTGDVDSVVRGRHPWLVFSSMRVER